MGGAVHKGKRGYEESRGGGGGRRREQAEWSGIEGRGQDGWKQEEMRKREGELEKEKKEK